MKLLFYIPVVLVISEASGACSSGKSADVSTFCCVVSVPGEWCIFQHKERKNIIDCNLVVMDSFLPFGWQQDLKQYHLFVS